jgi:hypothetical protein
MREIQTEYSLQLVVVGIRLFQRTYSRQSLISCPCRTWEVEVGHLVFED